jgi:hypothetical protein
MFDFIRDLFEDGAFGKIILALIVLFIILIPIGIYDSIQEQKEWYKFYVDHNCKKVGHIRGDTQMATGFGVTANGNVGTVITTTSTPDKNGYACDDGVTYWR